jgi:membrane protein implicated in regulation of membrane protease activity
MTPQQFRDHNRRLARLRNRRAYARQKAKELASGVVYAKRKWRVVGVDASNKIVINNQGGALLKVRKGSFLITFG